MKRELADMGIDTEVQWKSDGTGGDESVDTNA